MPRWLYVLVCLVLFAAVMLALRAVLHVTVPGAVDWASSLVGVNTLLVIMFVVFAAVGVWSYREHRRHGSARRR